MGDDITIGVTEIVNNIEVTAQPNDQIVDISVTDNADNVTLNITPTVVEVNINKGSSFAQWGDLYGTLSDQTDLQNALNLKANLVGGKVPASELPSYVDDIIEVANYAALPATGEIGKIYVTLDNNKIYRWSGSIYIEIAANNAIWGSITGTLSNQTDLQTALNAKQALLSGTGIVKSVGGTISYLTDNSANWDAAYNDKINSAAVTGTTTKTLTLTQQDGGTVTASWSDIGDNLSFTSPLVNTAGVVSIPAASGSVNGYLSSTDWTTFNNKQNAITNLIDGIVLAGYIPKSTSATSGLTTLGNSAIYDNSGKIGIGTTSPSAKLNVLGNIHLGSYSDTSINTYEIRTNKALFSIASDGVTNGNGTLITYSWANGGGGPLKFNNASGEVMRLSSGGNVGIGTTSPTRKLSVLGGTDGGVYVLSNAGATTLPNDGLALTTGYNVSYLSSRSLGVSGGVADLNYSAKDHIFDNGSTERMRITSGGQVQISSPISDALKLTNTNSGAYNGIIVQNDASNQVVLGMGGSTVGGTNQNRGYSGTVSNIDYYLMTNNSPRLLITSGGNVGIGTTSPSTKLDVVGAITASGGFFNSDMRLKDLTEYKYNVSDIKPITYLWKDGRDNKKHVGYSAQEVQKVMPDAVNEGTDGMLSVNYVEVLVAKIAELENRIKQLEK